MLVFMPVEQNSEKRTVTTYSCVISYQQLISEALHSDRMHGAAPNLCDKS